MAATVRPLEQQELSQLREFCEKNWGEKHPLIHHAPMFDYYYRRGGRINFLAAREEATGELLSVGGFIPASSGPGPDVFNSFLLSKKGGPLGLSLRVLEGIRELTRCRTLCCNNIRPRVAPLYNFLGCHTGWMTQFYRINPEITCRRLSVVGDPSLPPAGEGALALPVEREEQLELFPFESFRAQRPYKDRDYVRWRYLENPWLRYRLALMSDREGCFGIVVHRTIQHGGARVMRVVDYLGDREKLPLCGGYLDREMLEERAEFCDIYSFGLPEELMLRAGFLPRRGEGNILPNYLEPPLMENTDFMIQTSCLEGFAMFKADGDQDRPRVAL